MNTTQNSVLGSLRALIPRTRCRFGQSLTVAERQAAALPHQQPRAAPHTGRRAGRCLAAHSGGARAPAGAELQPLERPRLDHLPQLPPANAAQPPGTAARVQAHHRLRSHPPPLHRHRALQRRPASRASRRPLRRLQPGTAAGPPTRLASRHPPSGRVGQALPGAHRHRPDPPRPEPSGRSR